MPFLTWFASVRTSGTKKGTIGLSLICRKKMPLKKASNDFLKKWLLKKSYPGKIWFTSGLTISVICGYQLNLCKISLKWLHSKMRNQQLTRSNPINSGSVLIGKCEVSVLNYTFQTYQPVWYSSLLLWLKELLLFYFYEQASEEERELTNCGVWVISQNLSFLVQLWRCSEMVWVRVSGTW